MIIKPTRIDLDVMVNPSDCLPILGYPENKLPSERVSRRIDSLWALGQSLIRPVGIFTVIEREESEMIGLPSPTQFTGIGVVTIGRLLEEEAKERAKQGRILDSMILDAFGSLYAEASAESLNRYICKVARDFGLYAGVRVSPGYGRWALSAQEALLKYAMANEIGVTLTNGLMMVPKKSVSFAVRFRKTNSKQVFTLCKRCKMKECVFRRS